MNDGTMHLVMSWLCDPFYSNKVEISEQERPGMDRRMKSIIVFVPVNTVMYIFYRLQRT